MKLNNLILLSLALSQPAWTGLAIQPEYGYPECHTCYEMQQLCYEYENRKNCTDDILSCVKQRCTHYKQELIRW